MRLLRARTVLTRAVHLVLIVVALLGARQVARGVLSFWAERRDFIPRHWAVNLPEDAARLGLTDVSFPARDSAAIRGWYIPSRNRSALVLSQGSSSDRSAMLDDARALAAEGFGILLFDWPGHGESGGTVTYGATERAALQGAIDFLTTRADVDTARIGALGFSMGGYTVVQVAAIDPRLRAVVLAGTFDDPIRQTRHEYSQKGTLAVWGSLLALRMSGMETSAMRPVDVVARVAPRPLVIVSGSEDRSVPQELSRALFDAARDPKEFWLIPSAGHGDYGKVDGDYHRRVAAFFRRTLCAQESGSARDSSANSRKRLTPPPSSAP